MKSIRTISGCLGLVACVFVPACIGPPLLLEPTELPNAVEGTAYSTFLSTTDGRGPVWDVTDGALPDGLALNARSGEIAGTATTSGTFDFLVTATDTGIPRRTGEAAYVLTVIPKLTVNSSLAVGRVDEAYDGGLGITGGVSPYTVTIIGLPAGMDFDAATGAITGTPLFDYAARLLEYTVSDSGDPQQTVSGQTTLVVKPKAVNITTTSLPSAIVGQAYTTTAAAENGKTPYEWVVDAGVLPDGLHLTLATGVISGTPTTSAETETFTLKVTDSDSPESTDSQEFKLVVAVRIVTTSLPDGTAGGAYDQALTAIAGLPPYTWTVTSGQLPTGLTLNASSGVISGTIAGGAASQTFTVTVTDDDDPATTAAQQLTINVTP